MCIRDSLRVVSHVIQRLRELCQALGAGEQIICLERVRAEFVQVHLRVLGVKGVLRLIGVVVLRVLLLRAQVCG
eukprot:12157744-Alexandrium_andersonii.AAC.1